MTQKQPPIISLRRLLWLLVPGGIAIALLIGRIIYTDSFRYIFLVWNLFLAFVPLALIALYSVLIKRQRLLHWSNILLFIAFVAFVPNSFYLMTDYTHLRGATEVNINYDIVLLNAFSFAGVLWGLTSMFLLQDILRRRLSVNMTRGFVAGIYLLSSFAIYIGRFVRWNSWDIIAQPAAIIFDVSDQIVNPGMHVNAYLYSFVTFAVLYCLHITISRLFDR
jgi:uncharacterized membrane protein